MDVVLYETTGVIELRYYGIPLDASRYVSVGVENSLSAGSTDYVSILNNVIVDVLRAEQLTGNTVRILPAADEPTTPVVPVNPAIAPQPTTTTSTVYNATARVAPAAITLATSTTLIANDDYVQTVQLGFSFVFYNVTYTTAAISTNGNIQFATTGNSWSPDQVS